jgi:hypothetical protein
MQPVPPVTAARRIRRLNRTVPRSSADAHIGRSLRGQQTGSKRTKSLRSNMRKSLAGAGGRMNRAMPCPSSFTSRPSRWPVTPEVAGSSPVAPVFLPKPRLLVLRTGNKPRVQDGYISRFARGHTRALPTRHFAPICRTNVLANARTCTALPPLNFHGKEGVDGSSPSEGFTKGLETRGFLSRTGWPRARAVSAGRPMW